MPRGATVGQVRHLLGLPPKGKDAELKAYIESLLGHDWDGNALPSVDVRVLWDKHGKDEREKQDALAKRREAAVAQAKADMEVGVATYKAIVEHLANPNWRNMDQIAKALGLNDISSAFGMVQNYGIDPINLGVDGRYVQHRRRCPIWSLGRDGLDELVAAVAGEKATQAAQQEVEYQGQLAAANAVKDAYKAAREEKAALQQAEVDEARRAAQVRRDVYNAERQAEKAVRHEKARQQEAILEARAAERAARRAANTAAEDKRIAGIVDAEKARQKAAYEERYKKGWNFDFRWIGKRWRYVGYNIGPFGRPGKTGTMFQKMPDGSWELWLRGLAPRPRIIDGEDRTPPPTLHFPNHQRGGIHRLETDG